MKRSFVSSMLVLVTLLALTFGALGISPAGAAGLPPDSTADLVYGKPDFTTNADINADTLDAPMGAAAVDSSGNLYVADYSNNRVLYYPAGSTTATRVYGQGGSFTANTENNGGISANSLYNPYGVAVDSGGNLYVADNVNNRVLYYAAGSTTATRVYGQGGDFTTNTYNKGGLSANSLNSPSGVAVDSGGNLYVTDLGNNRVLYYAAGSTTATRVYGQGDVFTTGTSNKGGISANSLYYPYGIALDGSGNLYVADTNNNRVLYYSGTSTTATRVYGQGGSYNTNTANKPGGVISADSLHEPHGVAVDSGGVYVADSGNYRVLYYSGISTTATRVYGQAGAFDTNTDNKGGRSADSISYAWGVAVDSGGNLYVADVDNNRVLYYSGTSTTATRVYGQSGSYATAIDYLINNERLSRPIGVVLDSSGNLYVADINNNRVLYYPAGSTIATRVYGQDGNFTTADVNKGGLSANSLKYPSGVAVDSSGNLYVADNGNNRVLYYPAGSTTATRVYGQGVDFDTNTENKGGLSADSLSYPFGVALDGSGNLYVVDYGNNRVLYYSGTSTTATRVYGQGGVFTTDTDNKGGLSADSLSSPSGVAVGSGGVYVADYGNSRVLYYSGTDTTATRVYGQASDFTTDTENKGGLSADSLSYPEGVALDGSGNLYVADAGNNRVLYYSGTSTTATQVYGQGGAYDTNTENKGGVSATSLNSPRGVAVSRGGGLYVADRGNNRVLKYAQTGTSFGPISKWTNAFDLSHGWTVQNFVRTVGDVNNDGRDDLIGFGQDGVYVALSTGSGFGAISKWTSAFDLSHGWTVKDFVRTVGDVNNDGNADLIGFGLDGVYVALSDGAQFGTISKWTSAFDLSHGWTVQDYVRTVGDVNNDGRADLIGFGQDGVYVALSTGTGFGAIGKWTSAFDLSHGWTVKDFVRTVGDVNNDGRADLIGFGLDGVYVALSDGAQFGAISKWTSAFDLSHGWTVQDFVRTVGDVNNDGQADLIGFGLDGVYVALSDGAQFGAISQWSQDFDLSHGWTVQSFVRTVGDITGDGNADLVGFGLDGVYVAIAQ